MFTPGAVSDPNKPEGPSQLAKDGLEVEGEDADTPRLNIQGLEL